MMRYYRYEPDATDFAGIGFSLADAERIIQVHYTDTSLADGWAIPEAYGFDDNPETAGDFPSLSNFYRVPAMSRRAWDALRPLIGPDSEALPITIATGETYYIIHIMKTVAALDTARSDLTRNAATNRVNRIMRYAFKQDLLRGVHAFKLPLEDGAELIVDEDFRKTVEANGLRGLLFEELPLVP